MYNTFVDDDKLLIVYHKGCVDGFFSIKLFIEGYQKLKGNSKSEFRLVSATPNQISQRGDFINKIYSKKKIILDLPYFGNNVLYYFDHHISNQDFLPTNEYKGLFLKTAASTCELLYTFFNFESTNHYSPLVEIANIIDQAQFTTPPPVNLQDQFETKEDIIWGCNDLLKGKKDDITFMEIYDSFIIDDLKSWLLKNKEFIKDYRKKRKITIELSNQLEYKPIMLIKNQIQHIQVESLHFCYSISKDNYIMLVLVDKVKKKTTKHNSSYRISFRLNPHLSDDLMKKYRVDKIAKKLGGGGHIGAASAVLKNINTGYKELVEWLNEFRIEYTEQSLR